MPNTVPSGAGQQQLLPHEFTEALNAGSIIENTSPGPMALGAFGEMSNNEWTGRLYSNWNGTYAHAQASAAEAIGDPYAHAFLRCLSVRRFTSTQDAISMAKVFAT
jgi:hypothetical protein